MSVPWSVLLVMCQGGVGLVVATRTRDAAAPQACVHSGDGMACGGGCGHSLPLK